MELSLRGRERRGVRQAISSKGSQSDAMLCMVGGAANEPMDIEAMLATPSVAHPAGVLRLSQRAEDYGGPH